MRVVIQRVTEASVWINKQLHSQINEGLLILLGIHKDDKEEQVIWMAKKCANLRIFSDLNDKMNLNLIDLQKDALVVSQFTLYGDTTTSRRPDFFSAAPPLIAETLYNLFINELSKLLNRDIKKGVFGAKMEVKLINDGPVTIFIEK
ncbi:MAG: D-tyrosyl-tRNA(Tyr) deacylase [Parachlamydiales bacterium]|nr:D-tyrosyl-tRNA(Tyr) deacylase [Parachlamydiales bacterium]